MEFGYTMSRDSRASIKGTGCSREIAEEMEEGSLESGRKHVVLLDRK